MNGTTTSGLATDETRELIAASKVSGSPVFNRAAERLGSISELMLDKRRGHVEYAVMSFGGFLGMGDRYHPLPWSALTYDPDQGGYVVDLDRSRLEGAPSYGSSDTPDWSDPAYGRGVRDYYGVPVVM